MQESVYLAQKILLITASFLGVILVVSFFKKIGLLKDKIIKPLNILIIYITLPALIFTAVINASVSLSMLNISLSAAILIVILIFLNKIIGKKMALSGVVLGGWILAGTLGNTAYFGYPVVTAAFGVNNLINAVFFDYAMGFAITFLGISISLKYGKSDIKKSWSSTLLELLKFPALLVFVPAILLKSVDIPPVVTSSISYLGSVTIPLVLLSIGLTLKISSFNKNKGLLLLLAVIKLIVSPVLTFFIGLALGLKSPALPIAVVQAGMPTAMMTVIFGEKYGLDTKFLVGAVLLTTILSVITLPLIVILLF